jgi:hypothetical protein
MYFGSEHRDIIFLPIDGIDLQARSVNKQNNNTVFTVVRTHFVTVYNYYFSRNTSLEVYDDGATVLKCYFCFNLINCLVVIKIIKFDQNSIIVSKAKLVHEYYALLYALYIVNITIQTLCVIIQRTRFLRHVNLPTCTWSLCIGLQKSINLLPFFESRLKSSPYVRQPLC